MTDTTMITPEERARLREQADKSYLLPLDEDEVPSVGFDGLTDDRIAYIAAACNSVPRLLNALEAAEAENARLRERLEAALDKIAEIQDEWELEGVCHACGICAGIPYEWQRLDGFCCRVALGLWIEGKPLPWRDAARRVVGEEGRDDENS